jgi:hypothetical protein
MCFWELEQARSVLFIYLIYLIMYLILFYFLRPSSTKSSLYGLALDY